MLDLEEKLEPQVLLDLEIFYFNFPSYISVDFLSRQPRAANI